jgi:predicted nucleotidyltransferase
MSLAELPPLVRQAVAIAIRDGRPQEAYLFGSHGRGDATGASDVDLLLVYEARVPPPIARGLRQRFAAYPLRVDLVFRTRSEVARAAENDGDTFLITALRRARKVHPYGSRH